MMRPPITLGIATSNRVHLLRQTLESATSLRVPVDVAWELLVYDNNSTEDTRAVVESFAGRLPVRYLFEPKQGKAHALNRIVNEASGQWVLFTDDDVRLEPDWIEQYLAGIDGHAEADCFGGPVLPWLERSPGRLTLYLLRVFPWVMSVFAVPTLASMKLLLVVECSRPRK